MPKTSFISRCAEMFDDVLAVSSFRCGGKAKELFWLEVMKYTPVCRGLGVVELVDHDVCEVIRSNLIQSTLRQRLNRTKHVPPGVRSFQSDVELAKVRVFHHGSESAERLLENVFAVGDKEKTGPSACFRSETVMIKCSKKGLACSGRGHYEVLVLIF